MDEERQAEVKEQEKGMTAFIRMVAGDKPASEKKNFIWNMLGSGIYSFISMFLSILVIRIMGEKMGGVFSIAITISQMMLYIAYFELRTFQVTDVEHRFSFAQYHGAKLLTCLCMMIASVVYVAVKGYGAEKTAIVLLMCVYRMLEGYADLYEGEFQLNDRLYLAGKSMAFRSMISSACFLLALALTHQMILSLCITIVVALIVLWLFDLVIAGSFEKIRPSFEWSEIKSILIECFPLFIGAFLWVYILSASRIAIDENMPAEYQAYYQTLFMPVSIINLFATFFFRPALTTLAKLYSERKGKEFLRKIVQLLAVIGIFTVLCMAGAYVLGIPVLSLMSGCELGEYRMVLVFLMAAGGMNSASFFLYYILTTMRKPKSVLVGYVSAAVLTALISPFLVRRSGIWGAAVSFFVTVVYLSLVFAVCIYIHYRRDFSVKKQAS